MTTVTDRVRSRIAIVAVVVFALLATLLVRLWYLQVLAGENFSERAQRNAVRIVVDEAPRGRIFDRDGKILVRNRTALAVGVRRRDLPGGDEGQAVKTRLADLLGIKLAALEERLKDQRSSPFEPVVVARDVPPRVIFAIRERRHEYPGVESMTLPVREYPSGSLAAQVIGYLSEVNPAELEEREGYLPGDRIGRTGLERQYEDDLRGRPGRRKLEVDAAGSVLRVLGRAEPVPGADLNLTIDRDVQRVAEQALEDGIKRARAQRFRRTGAFFRAPAGAAVVLDARTGAVVAMASAPTFDLERFVGGVSAQYFTKLNDPDEHQPMLNRTIQSAYPPGSTFKPIVASAALTEGAATKTTRLPCKTEFRFGDRIFRNWQPRDAQINLRQALIESCDTPFYAFARDWWVAELGREEAGQAPKEIMATYARHFGLDVETGIDLSGYEEDGRIPDRRWRLEYWEANRESYCRTARRTGSELYKDLCERGYRWRGGDSVNLSIGQGDVLTSPLQMAVVYSALANGGKVMKPFVTRSVTTPDGEVVRQNAPEVKSRVPVSKQTLDYIKGALVETARTGTAQFAFRQWPHAKIPMAAKTGSAEIAGKQPFSWFAAFAPANDPKYVVVSVVEQAGSGGQVSGPIVRRIMDELFDQRPLPIVFGTRSD
jgi:penicillin-binding protein 2